MIKYSKLLFLFIFSSLFLQSSVMAKKRLAINEIAIDFPLDGGAMVTASRMWSMNRFLKAGFVIGGGVIKRDFEVDFIGGPDLDAETEALILPFIGPRVTLQFEVVGLSVAYGAFYGKTDFTVSSPNGDFAGEESAWGTGFYSPLIALDFYNKKLGMVFGFGLGGYLSSSYPKLEATRGNTVIRSDESPLDTITFHVRTSWASGRKSRRVVREEEDDYFE